MNAPDVKKKEGAFGFSISSQFSKCFVCILSKEV